MTVGRKADRAHIAVGGVSHHSSPDHLVGPLEQGRGNGDANGLGGLEIDDEVEFRHLRYQRPVV